MYVCMYVYFYVSNNLSFYIQRNTYNVQYTMYNIQQQQQQQQTYNIKHITLNI